MPGHGGCSHEEAHSETELRYERLPSHCRALDVVSRPETPASAPGARFKGTLTLSTRKQRLRGLLKELS